MTWWAIVVGTVLCLPTAYLALLAAAWAVWKILSSSLAEYLVVPIMLLSSAAGIALPLHGVGRI